MIKSKLTTKAQMTIRQPVREALRLRAGDEIVYRIEEGRVILSKASSPSLIRRTNIATIEARHADRIGRLTPELWDQVQDELRTHLALE